MHVDRRQLCWTMLDVERLVDEDHPARAIWELVGRLGLSAFVDRIGSLEGGAGRPAFDPQFLVSLWIYAYSRGISSARGRASLRARSWLPLADGPCLRIRGMLVIRV
jgi:transposase